MGESSPVLGMVNEPLFVFVIGPRNGWVWVLWCSSTTQLKALAARVPSSGSVPPPAKGTTVPPE